MRLAVHILRDAVLDGMMVVGQPHVGPVLIGVDGRIVGYPLSNEPLKRRLVRALTTARLT